MGGEGGARPGGDNNPMSKITTCRRRTKCTDGDGDFDKNAKTFRRKRFYVGL